MMRNIICYWQYRLLVDSRRLNIVFFQIFLLDLLVCKINSREDQQRQVEVSEDGVTCGYKLNDTDLGSSCAVGLR